MDDVQRWMAQISILVYLVLNVVFWPVVLFSIGWLLWKLFTDRGAISTLGAKIRNLWSTDKSEERQTKTKAPRKKSKVTDKDARIADQNVRIAELEELVEQYATPTIQEQLEYEDEHGIDDTVAPNGVRG